MSSLPEQLDKIGARRALLVTSKGFVKRGVADKLAEICKGKIVALYSCVSPNPTAEQCDSCIEMIHENSCDSVIALGGGSVMDCAKAAACICSGDSPVESYLRGADLPNETLPVIAMPTTSGTGSELTRVSVISEKPHGTKFPIRNDILYPKLAVVDPALTDTMPRHSTASTGMDAMCHALEGYWSKNHLPKTADYSIPALELIFDNLEEAYCRPTNQSARDNMAKASVLAGIAFSKPGTTAPHACSYPITTLLGIDHGEACGLTIVQFMMINAEHDEEGRIDSLASALGYGDAERLGMHINAMKKNLRLCSDLESMELRKEDVDELVRGSHNSTILNNPVDVDDAMLYKIYMELACPSEEKQRKHKVYA